MALRASTRLRSIYSLSDTLFFFSISYRFGHFGPGSAETDIAVLSFRLAKRGRTLVQKVLICLAERGAYEQKLAVGHQYLLQKSP
jgi:hypothetical protein